MATEPHPPRIDATTGYWFTRWYEDVDGRPAKRGKKFGHQDKVTKSQANRLFHNWLVSRGKKAPAHSGNLLAALIAAYQDHARVYYRRADGTLTGEHVNIDYALKPLAALFGHLDAGELRPRHIKEYLSAQIENGTARSTINKRLGIIKRLYVWAASEEFVEAEVAGGIGIVPTLEKGRTEAVEPAPIAPVPLRHLAATLRHLDPVVQTMARLQWHTGMRPGEVCNLMPAQVDRTRTTWLYNPPLHKTAHREKVRIVALGPKARALLQPYLFGDKDTPCFSPQVSRRWWNQQRRTAAKVPRATARLKEIYARVGDRFNAKSYGDAIERAARKAKVALWTPNQIRHAAGTRANASEGKQAAKRLLGHSNAKTTAIYITEDVRELMAMAERAG